MCVCALVLHSLLLPSREGRAQAISSECKINQSDCTDWISFLSSNLMEEISPNSEALSANTQSL